jgi:ubiquinol-cytochrome c reductase cytochrome c subunit
MVGPRLRRLPWRAGRRSWRQLAGAVALGCALLAAGGFYTVLLPRPQVASAQSDDALVAQGRQLYATNCITCHGSNLQGVPDRGPSLVGVGDAATYFQVSTGRMPLARQEAQAERKPPAPEFDPATPQGGQNLRALGAYVEANGGGPQRPPGSGRELVGSDISAGGELFRLNCSSCHNFTGRGGALLSGKYAPNLHQATPEQIYTAMLSGPQAMPAFSDRQLAPEEKENIIAYVLSVEGQQNSPGGFNLGELGPTTEGAIAFLVGLAALVAITAWLGSRS